MTALPSFLHKIDFACIVTAFLFWTSDILGLIVGGRYFRSHRPSSSSKNDGSGTFSFDFLDPTRIQEEWELRAETRGLYSAAGMIGAVAWFFLCIPILNVAWILSSGGRKRVAPSACIATLALAGSISELLARLMHIGVERTGTWLARDWNLDNWLNDGSDDMLGWRCLEVAFMLSNGLILWVDSFEWFALSAIFVLIFLGVWEDKEDAVFSQKWARYGMVLAALCMLDFLADTLRLHSWITFSVIARVLGGINTMILFPVWLLWLGNMLPEIRRNFEASHDKSEEEAFVTGENQVT